MPSWKITCMIIIKRDKVTFYIKDENVIVSNNDIQHTAYSVYALQNRGAFHQFRDTILNSKPSEFTKIVEVVGLSSRCGIYGEPARKPKLEDIEHEFRP